MGVKRGEHSKVWVFRQFPQTPASYLGVRRLTQGLNRELQVLQRKMESRVIKFIYRLILCHVVSLPELAQSKSNL